ncbi:MAG: hypothetical protein ACOC40_00450 [Thermoplasmatota archaeon]
MFISPSDVNSEGIVEKTVSLDAKWTYWVDGWDLTVRFADNAGNVFTKERHVDGVVESAVDAVTELAGKIVDLLTGLWDTIVDGLSEAAGKAVQMANRFVEWVKNKVSLMFSSVVDPIVDGLQNWAVGVAFSFIGLLDELNKWETVDGDESVEATKSQGMKFLLSLVGLQDKAEKIQTVMKKVSNFASPFMKYISPYGVAGLFGEAFGEDIEGLGSYYDDIKNGIAGGLSTVISYTLNLFVGDENSLLSALGISGCSVSGDINYPSLNALNNYINHGDIFNDDGITSMVFEKLEIESGPVGDVSNAMLVTLGVIATSIFAGIKAGKIVFNSGNYMIDATKSMIIEIVGLALTIASSTLDGVKSLLVSTVGSAWTTFFYTTSIDDYLKLAKDWPVGTILTGIGTGEVIACYTGFASYF